MELIYFAIPFFFLTMFLEWARLRGRTEKKGYERKDTFASLSMGVGSLFVSAAVKIPEVAMYVALYELRLFDLPDAWWVWPLLIVAEDHCYYWFHRIHHTSRMFWAGHVNHHSSQHYNLSTALRQSWTSQITGMLFWAPLPLLGFRPEMILVAKSISLLYQYWIHTELIDRMGPLEWVLNTPSHHRVHHGSNPLYLDRNHGGILIVWDRLYGTFQPEVEPADYGLTTNIETFNPLRIAFHEWAAMIRDVRTAKTLRGALGYIFGPPGFREDGSGLTAKQLREAAMTAHRQQPAE
ncbi:MAG: sterol desaturase family protein [Myxococcales bacterium]|nr:sterol desaturase family protein [Myxococcales bacterium]